MLKKAIYCTLMFLVGLLFGCTKNPSDTSGDKNGEIPQIEGDILFSSERNNNWDIYVTPMKKLKNGAFTLTLDLNLDTEYQFRYLIDETKWENDWHADKYVPTPYGNAENSVVVVTSR